MYIVLYIIISGKPGCINPQSLTVDNWNCTGWFHGDTCTLSVCKQDFLDRFCLLDFLKSDLCVYLMCLIVMYL